MLVHFILATLILRPHAFPSLLNKKNAEVCCIEPAGLEFDKCVLMVGKHTANK